MGWLSKKILVSITGSKEADWQSKLDEINKRSIKKIALFLEIFEKSQRNKIYKALLSSCVKKIPLVHLRNDMTAEELIFLKENFNPKYFTIHESSFKHLDKWKGFEKQLFLEMNTDNVVPEMVKVDKIGGFCVDLSHFKVEQVKKSKEFAYISERKNIGKYFKCNHLNGYSYKTNKDVHTIKNLNQFAYLTTLPKFVFGEYIAMETFNPISQQLKFRDHVNTLI